MPRMCNVLLVLAAVLSCSRRAAEKAPADAGGGRTYSDPREISDTYVRLLVEEPTQALSLMEREYQANTDPEQFARLVRMMLPGYAATARIEFARCEDGFVETDQSGEAVPSSAFHYRLIPQGGAQAAILEIHVARHGDECRVRRFAIPGM